MNSASIIWQIIDCVFLVNIAFAIIIVLFERRDPSITLTWLLLLLFIPVLGLLLYIFLGQDLRKKRIFYLKKEEEQLIYELIHEQEESLASNKLMFDNPRVDDYRDLIHLHLHSDQSLLSQNNGVSIFNSGPELFHDLLQSLKNAANYIHMEYYIIRNDSLGKELVEILSQRAAAGVEVKFLYDGMGCLRLPRNFFQPLVDAGGQVACFFPPFLPYINLRINYRNHRKISIIDGKKAYVGGFNIGNEYLGLSRRFGYWRDTHLSIEGDAIDSLEVRFLLDWRHASGQKGIDREKYTISREAGGTSPVQIVPSGPDSRWAAIRNGYLKIVNQAKKKVYIQTPYFIPDESILQALKIAALSGVDVRLVIPDKADHPFVHWASLSFAGELLEAGAKCYAYNKGFIHSKMIVSDGFACSVGTANMDIRSFELNFEVNAFIYDERVGQELEQAFIEDLLDCSEIELNNYKKRSLSIRFKEGVSRLLSPVL